MLAERVLRPGFTIIEVVAAVTILALICATVMVVLDRCMQETIDSELKMQAFKVARENMEKLLGNNSVEEMVEFGTLDENPNIDWRMVVEPFYEPITSEMWIRAVCTATYTDSHGEMRNFELENWVTKLTDAQVKLMENQKEREKEFIDATGENPFGNDAEGLLKWMNHLMETGDIDSAKDVAEQIKIKDPEKLPEDFVPKAKPKTPNEDGLPNESAEPNWQKMLDEGMTLSEIVQKMFEDAAKKQKNE